jgi:hypothetical protein
LEIEKHRDRWEWGVNDDPLDKFSVLMKDQLAKGACSILREIENPTPETILGVTFEQDSSAGDDRGDEEGME